MQYPSEYNYVLRDVRKDIDARKTSAITSLTNADESERSVTEALTKVTMQFLTTGIADLDPDLISDYAVPFKWGSRSHFNWVYYCRHLATELRRPCVIVHHHPHYHDNGVSYTVYISKKAYTKPLWAWFMLLPKAQIYSDTRYWRFSVWSEQAEMLPAWRELCRSDPSYRAALRLT